MIFTLTKENADGSADYSLHVTAEETSYYKQRFDERSRW
jgi:hypothetical protein